MSFTIRVCAFLVIAVAGFFVWHCTDSPREATELALRQFQNSDAVASDLDSATLLQSWWPLVWPALALVIGVAMFWDDAERWWSNQSV
jgi:hypothetical protein